VGIDSDVSTGSRRFAQPNLNCSHLLSAVGGAAQKMQYSSKDESSTSAFPQSKQQDDFLPIVDVIFSEIDETA
jgi:hypothetical protein